MKTEEIDETLNQKPGTGEENKPAHEEALSDGHNPDLGTPEDPAAKNSGSGPMNEADKLRFEAADWKDKYLRLYAEFDNFRKRSSREKIEILSTSNADLIKDLLPVIDDFDRAVKANENVSDANVLKEGFGLIHQKLYKKLESRGLKPIDATGKTFDTDYHEAITSIPAPDPSMKGKVVEEVERGYMINDRVLRFSKVITGQ